MSKPAKSENLTVIWETVPDPDPHALLKAVAMMFNRRVPLSTGVDLTKADEELMCRRPLNLKLFLSNMPETADASLRLAIYARVSTEEQREGQTIDSQISELERFTREKSWLIAAIYKDEGWSGGVMERPELDRLRDDAQKGVFEAVLINDVDRLARDVAHLGVIKRDLERKGIKVIFRKLPSDASPTNNLMVNMSAII